MRKIPLLIAALAGVGFVAGSAVAQPVNDNCADASVIGLGATDFDTTGATTDGPDEPGCQFPGGNNLINQDIWYSFTPPGAGEYVVSTCNMASYDTRLAVYADACPVGPDEAVACNDDFEGCAGFTSKLTFEAREQATYLIRIGGFNAGEGPGTVEITAVPQGEDCNENGVPDQCDLDCNNEGCEQFPECGTYPDCNGNQIPDECEGEGFLYELEVNEAIPDFDPNGLMSTINVGDAGTISDVNVAVTVTHTFVGDLTIDIDHGGVSVRLWNRQCSLNDDLDVVFDDEGDPVVCGNPTVGRFQPTGSLRDFDFLDINGDWTLTVADNASQDFGTLVKWGIAGTLRGFDCCTGNLLASNPPDGAIDARELHEFGNPDNLTGLSSILLTFDDNSTIVAQCFGVGETGGGLPPAIAGVERLPGNGVRVNFDRPITEQQWTTLGYNGSGGQVLVDIGFLPGDVNQSKQSTGRDVSELIDCLNEVIVCADYQTDIDRSGNPTGNDITRLINVLQEVPNQDPRAWLNETIVDEPNP